VTRGTEVMQCPTPKHSACQTLFHTRRHTFQTSHQTDGAAAQSSGLPTQHTSPAHGYTYTCTCTQHQPCASHSTGSCVFQNRYWYTAVCNGPKPHTQTPPPNKGAACKHACSKHAAPGISTERVQPHKCICSLPLASWPASPLTCTSSRRSAVCMLNPSACLCATALCHAYSSMLPGNQSIDPEVPSQKCSWLC
jgi:hypothetical protein